MTYLLETEDGEWGGEHARQEKSLRKKIYGKFPGTSPHFICLMRFSY